MGFHHVVDNFTIQAPETVHVVKLRNKEGVMIELINNMVSRRVENITNPVDGSRYQGYFHWALRVADMDESFTYLTKEGTGARGVVSPSPNVSGGGRYAYVADPEGNLIELIELEGFK
ncbi:glyoxalase-like domain-containing protein [Pochonia chlamydosporia 170]|uniref:Glyoxalase-like domain-containing protein n=1 Tax=Pochonia chlamydosporia 170 TaxID=1380566 RepID=A0A179G9K6_METCM|nr:glyoxalase-like domain-containing protein [Pochonia chlamydosporia 170]OAQ74101.1 glyoxalase-like domain-containing protein [Pochonia chlamydosporia 170]